MRTPEAIERKRIYDHERRLALRGPVDKRTLLRAGTGATAEDQRTYLSKNVEIVTESGCWVWVGTTAMVRGYGLVTYNSKRLPAHRFSWVAHHGEIPAGKMICHTCDVRICVNPSHLYVGDHKTNTADAVRRRRMLYQKDLAAWGKRTSGERHGRAKLRENDVKEILQLSRAGWSCADLASRFSIGVTQVRYICNGKSWKEAYQAFKAEVSNAPY